MSPQPDIQKPADDPYDLVGGNWVTESESAYRTAETSADTLSTTTRIQAESADDAGGKMGDEKGKTAESVSDGYSSSAEQLQEQSVNYITLSAWMLEAASKVLGAKKHIASLVLTGTQAIREALNSELAGDSPSPSSSDLIAQYRADIAQAASTLTADLDDIGHSLKGDPGSSRTPSYTSVPATPSTERPDPRAVVTAYNTGQAPEVAPHELPPMPRAVNSSSAESTSTPGTPAPSAAPHSVNPTLAGLISGNASPSDSATAPSTSSSRGAASGTTPAGQGAQAHQPSEQHQAPKSTVLPRVPSVPLPDLPAAAATITTAVTSATASQLPVPSTAPTSPGASSAPASTGFTPGTSGSTPMPAGGLAPIGGLPTPPPVVQAPPAPQASPASPTSPGVQTPSTPQSPAPRGPLVDAAWLQRTYGTTLPEPSKPETPAAPALFIAELPEPEAHLHRALATIRSQFEQAGWSQSLAVATIKRGFESRTVYATADGLSIHPHMVFLPSDVLPLDEMPGVPADSHLSGSLMVSEKLTSLIPRGWEIEHVLSTVSGGEGSQSAEQYQELVDAEEVLSCKVSRGRDGVGADEALRVFARAAIGRGGCGELDVESARIRAARWIGTQPAGYLDTLARFYLSDAAESMSRGLWGEAVWASEKYMSLNQSRSQVA